MTQFIEPNKKSDLTAPRVLDWLQSLRSGLLSGFGVSFNSGFNVDIASGRVVIGGTTIHDDATRLNQSGLILPPGGNNEHWIVYVSYAYADTFPPSAMTIGAVRTVATAAPPAVPAIPSLPVNSVKIADIFVPGGAGSLATATFINAPPLPAQGNADGDVLLERLVASNANIAVTGGGGVTLSGAGPLYTLTWSADINVLAPPITHREKFGTAPLVHARIAAGNVTSVPANAIIFTHVDRRSPNTYAAPQAATMLFIDLDAPSPPQMANFAPASDRDKVIILGRVTGGVLAMTGSLGALPVPTTEPPPRFLGMDPGGAHAWETVDDVDLVGGLQSVADAAARDLIPVAQVKEGMVVYLQDVDRHQVREGGAWVELGDDNRLVGGMRIISSLVAGAIPVSKQKIGALVYNLATSSLQQITAIADPPTLGAVRFLGTVHSGSLDADGGIGRSVNGTLSVGSDANVTGINIGTTGNTGTVSIGQPSVPTTVNRLNVEDGIKRATSGALSIGDDSNVTDINIGITGNTGNVSIGQASVPTTVHRLNVEGGIKRATLGFLTIGVDANVNNVYIATGGATGAVNIGAPAVPTIVVGELNADGGIGRSTSGAMNIGNDANVNNINIGTSASTGAITIGKLTGSSLVIGNERLTRTMTNNFYEDSGTHSDGNIVVRRAFAGLSIGAVGVKTSISSIGYDDAKERVYAVKFVLCGQSDIDPDQFAYLLDGVAFFSGRAQNIGNPGGVVPSSVGGTVVVDKTVRISDSSVVTNPVVGNDRVIPHIERINSGFELLSLALEPGSTSFMANSVWSGVIEWCLSSKP
jgi:hypothetical protein